MTHHPEQLTIGKSNLLNIMRWVCALLVVIEHASAYASRLVPAMDIPSHGLLGYLTSHARASVLVFFVLSGYLIAYTATVKRQYLPDYGPRGYFVDRWSRIYSVLIAAVLCTVMLDRAGLVFSSAYTDASLIPQSNQVIRLLVNLFCLQGIQGYRVQLGSNPALWSIGYEFIYYIIFGLFFFRRQLSRRTFIPTMAICAIFIGIGWKMSAYFLLWLMGAGAYVVFGKRWVRFPAMTLLPFAAALIVANHILYHTTWVTLPTFGKDLLFAMSVSILLLVDYQGSGTWRRIIAANQFMADFSFTTYAFHMPVIFFYLAVVHHRLGWQPSVQVLIAFLTATSLTAARLLYWGTERQRWRYKHAADRLLSAGAGWLGRLISKPI